MEYPPNLGFSGHHDWLISTWNYGWTGTVRDKHYILRASSRMSRPWCDQAKKKVSRIGLKFCVDDIWVSLSRWQKFFAKIRKHAWAWPCWKRHVLQNILGYNSSTKKDFKKRISPLHSTRIDDHSSFFTISEKRKMADFRFYPLTFFYKNDLN